MQFVLWTATPSLLVQQERPTRPAATFGWRVRVRADDLRYSIQVLRVRIGLMILREWQLRLPSCLSLRSLGRFPAGPKPASS